MKFEDSIHYNKSKCRKVTLPFGDFYLLDHYCIAEMYEGVHIGIEESEDIILALVDFYGEDLKIGFISNRMNSFSIDLRQWIKLNTDFNFIVATAIVIYDDLNFNTATIEKMLSKNSTKRCVTLNEAIEWINGLKEFKETINELSPQYREKELNPEQLSSKKYLK